MSCTTPSTDARPMPEPLNLNHDRSAAAAIALMNGLDNWRDFEHEVLRLSGGRPASPL